MGEQHGQPARQCPLLALAQVFDLLGQVLDIEFRQTAGAQQVRLLFGPGDDVAVV